MEGTLLGERYRLGKKLGEGGMGAVYEAVHEGTGGRVAVKVILDAAGSDTALARFMREARAAAAVQSQHIVRVFDVGLDAPTGRPYMVMELLPGHDVASVLREQEVLPESTVIRIAQQACTGLAAAHRVGIVHRDIKPANLFLAQRDLGDLEVKVLDFGVAKLKQEVLEKGQEPGDGLTQTGAVVGSPHYMSPEQAKGSRDLDARSDLWSLAVAMYKMLSGRFPHSGDTLGEIIVNVCSEAPLPISEVAPWVSLEMEQFFAKALARRRDDRFQTAEEMGEALRRLAAPHGARSIRPNALVAPTSEHRASQVDARERSRGSSGSNVARSGSATDARMALDATQHDPTPRPGRDDHTLVAPTERLPSSNHSRTEQLGQVSGTLNTARDPALPSGAARANAARNAWILRAVLVASAIAAFGLGIPRVLRHDGRTLNAGSVADAVQAPVVRERPPLPVAEPLPSSDGPLSGPIAAPPPRPVGGPRPSNAGPSSSGTSAGARVATSAKPAGTVAPASTGMKLIEKEDEFDKKTAPKIP